MDTLSEDSEVTAELDAQRSAAAARSTWVSVLVNILLSTTQVGAGLVSNSQGLIADGIHSLSDLVADFIVLFAGHHSKKDADQEHPYGHQRFETAASLALGLILLGVGMGMLWAAFRKLEFPGAVPRLIPGGGYRHYRQPGGLPHPRPDCGTHRRLSSGENGVGVWMAGAA